MSTADMLGLVFLILIMIPMSGYAIGRTVVMEAIFAPMRDRILYGPYAKVTDEHGTEHYLYPQTDEDLESGETPRTGDSWFYATNEHSTPYEVNVPIEDSDEIERVLVIPSPNVYQPGFIGRLKGMFADLATECMNCASANSSVWVSATVIVLVSLLSVKVAVLALIPTTAVGLVYSWLNLFSWMSSQGKMQKIVIP